MKDPEWFWGLGNPQDYWYKGYGKTRAIDSQSWIATKTSDKGFTRAWSARPLGCRIRTSSQESGLCGHGINYARSLPDRVLLHPCFRPKTNYSF